MRFVYWLAGEIMLWQDRHLCVFRSSECTGNTHKVKGHTLSGFTIKRVLCDTHKGFKEVWE